MNMVLRWIIGAVALYITVKISEATHIGGLWLANGQSGIASAFVVILILTLVNAFIRPIVNFFFAGLNCLTLGLFSFVVNALMFLLVSYISAQLKLGFHVRDFWSALIGSVALSVITGILSTLLPDKDRGKRR